MSDLPSIAEIAARAAKGVAKRKPNINTGTLYGGQHVDNSTYGGDYYAGDYVAGNKSGKKAKKKK
ncbi:hypothetical protein ACF07M_20355 [Streptomyces globisporus]|uniref:hypothetical protein n=1 Tax=Streptomyces globisporus TaxID=1908 RepID=UPI0036F9FCDF